MKLTTTVDVGDMWANDYGETIETFVRDEIISSIKSEVKRRLKEHRAEMEKLILKATDEQLDAMRKQLESLVKK